MYTVSKPPDEGRIHAGASGAIWGLMTATLVYNLRNNLNPFYALRGIAINLIYSFSAGVSWQGHIGGGLGGVIAALFLCGQKQDYYLDQGGNGGSDETPYNPYGS